MIKNKIDWEFISELEGNKLSGYVPDPAHSKSGVTIASGFDLGCRASEELIDEFGMLGCHLANYAGLKGYDAEEALEDMPISITQKEADMINEYAHEEALERIDSEWLKATGEDFSDLPPECQTVVASVSFQYGYLKKATPNFWSQVINDDWEGAYENLRDFGDRYPTRRNKEADYLWKWLGKGNSFK